MLDSYFQIAFIGPGGPELLVVMLVLLLMFGAKDAPKIFRKINEMLNTVRNTADGFKREIMYGDMNSDSSSSSDDTYSADDDDDYTEYHDDDYDYMDDDEERDYSNETFQNLEKDLEESGVETLDEQTDGTPVPESVESDEEADDARKA